MANYHYDEAGYMAAYFMISFLAVVLIPLTLSLSPTSNKQPSDSCQCELCIEHRKLLHKEENGTLFRPKVSIRTIFIISGWVMLVLVGLKAARAKFDNKIYNPFEILGLRSGVTEKEIKAHFKNLSRIYHPDKVKLTVNETMESAANRFVDITKAYKALTDENIRKNWELYGHPDGRQEMSMGIALPHWVIEGRNNIWVLSIYALVFGGALPLMVGRWWFGSRQKTKDGVNAQTAAIFFKTLREESGMNEIIGILGRCFRWEWPTSDSASTELSGMESRIQLLLGQHWSDIARVTAFDHKGRNRRALILLFSHLLRITNENPSLRKEQSLLVLQMPQLLSALMAVSTSRNWLLPTLSVMRLHAYLTQAVIPGDDCSKFAQLPGIRFEETKELGSQVSDFEDFVQVLNAKADSRAGDVKKAVQNWGRLELIEASFKVIGERVITPSAIVFLVVKLRISPPLDGSVPESGIKKEDVEDVKRTIKMNEDKDAEFLTSRKDAEDLEQAIPCGWAHAPYWPKNRKPAWWLVLADEKTNRVVVPPIKITDVPLSRLQVERNYRSYKLQFQAPPNSGMFTWKIHLVSDTFVGEEISCDITLKIDDLSALDPEEQWVEDEISEPDEDSLAGQMALMKGGSIKRVDDGESNESSATDNESESDSDSD